MKTEELKDVKEKQIVKHKTEKTSSEAWKFFEENTTR